jgi:small conductance mechanosensitive channel
MRNDGERTTGIDRMFETRTDAWEAVGLAAELRHREIRRARTRALVLLGVVAGVIVAYALRHRLFGAAADTPVRIATVVLTVILGWAIARDFGRAAAPTLFRRMDPATSGTIGFLIRLVTIGVTLLVALEIAQISPSTLVAGTAFTAVILGLAAQQTLGNLFAGLVLVSARPFQVGERVRLQAGGLAGATEGVVSSLGLLYTTLARGEDRIMIPNNTVLSAAVVPLREPASVDVRVRLGAGVRPTDVQAILDDHVATPTRDSAKVLLEEVDGDDLVVRIQATPEKPVDGPRLADEVVEALTNAFGDGRARDADAPQ